MSLKTIDANIRKIVTNAQKLNELVHETAMLIIKHANEHGDCTRAQQLVMAMPASMRRTMLIAWFAKYTPIVVKNDDKWNAKMHKEGTNLYKPFDITGAGAEPFWKIAEDTKEKEALDAEGILKLITGLAKRLKKQVDDGNVKEGFEQSALEAVSQLEKIKVKPPKADNDASPKSEAIAA